MKGIKSDGVHGAKSEDVMSVNINSEGVTAGCKE